MLRRAINGRTDVRLTRSAFQPLRIPSCVAPADGVADRAHGVIGDPETLSARRQMKRRVIIAVTALSLPPPLPLRVPAQSVEIEQASGNHASIPRVA
jgi:hypothetical protein